MFRSAIARATLALFLLAAAASAASLDRARELYREHRLDEAKQELTRLLDSDSGDRVRAAALDLLAAIAVQEQDFQAARAHWAELAVSHADHPEALAAEARLDLIDALLECRGEAESPTLAEGAVPAAPEPAAPEGPAVLDRSAAQARESLPDLDPTPPAEAPAPVPPRSEPPPPAPSPAPGLLLIGGTGQPYDSSQEAIAMVLEFLRQRGVELMPGDTEIPAIRGEEAVLAFLLTEARERGAAGLLFVTTRFGFREYVRVERFSPEGVSLWKEMVRGGFARKGVLEQDQVNEALLERFLEKLEKRIGTPDLAVE